MNYRIVPRNPNAQGVVETADGWNVRERVAELSGRDVLGFSSVMRQLRSTGIVYIALNRAAPARAQFGNGMVVIDLDNPRGVEQAASLGLPA